MHFITLLKGNIGLSFGKKVSSLAHNVPSIAAVAELELQNFKTSTNEQ